MMPQAQVVYWLGFLSGTPFGTTIGMLHRVVATPDTVESP
jgi:hypothetical protein